MRPESRKLLRDALDAALAIEEFVKGRALEDLRTDRLFRSAIYWQFAIIGEALSQLGRSDEATFDRITESSRFGIRSSTDIRSLVTL